MVAHRTHGALAPTIAVAVVAIHLVPLALLLWWAGEDGGELFFLAGVSLPLLLAIVAAQALVLTPHRAGAGLVAPRSGALIWTLPPLAAAGALLLVGADAAPDASPHLLLILAGIVMAAAAEEITFRGAVFSVLAPRGELIAVLGSATIFGLAHMIAVVGGVAPAAAGSQAIGAFGFGLVLAVVRLRTGSLVGPVLIHIAWNIAVLSGDLRPGFLAEPLAAVLVIGVLLAALVGMRARRRVALGM